MNNVKPFVNKEDIHEQACAWISRIDRGLDKQEKQVLYAWAEQSKAHKQMLFEVAELWDELSTLNELSGLFPLRIPSAKQRTVWSAPVRWSIAASIFFVVVSSTWTLSQWLPNSEQTIAVQTYYETQVGEQQPINLSDGSLVHLNTNSAVQINYSPEQRNIRLLRGEAFFDVAHNPDRPFVVTAANSTVTAVGTAFNIQLTREQGFEVLVTDGKVRVDATAEEVSTTDNNEPYAVTLMEAGQKVAFLADDNAGIEQLSLDQVQRDLSWQQGMLVFQGDSLIDALQEVSRYSAFEFEVLDQDIKQTRVAGYFKVGDIDGLLSTLKNNFAIQSQQVGSHKYLLSAAN